MVMHPITIMVLLLLSSNIYGVIGMIVAIPVYSIGKEIVKFCGFVWNHKKTQEQRKHEELKSLINPNRDNKRLGTVQPLSVFECRAKTQWLSGLYHAISSAFTIHCGGGDDEIEF